MSTAQHLIDRTSHRRKPVPGPAFLGDLTLQPSRVHEFCGAARRRLALKLAGALQGPVFWIRPSWTPETINPEGILKLVDPARLTFVTPQRPEDLLWTMEEVLRAGLVTLTVTDLPEPPGLTAIRRLHLAAETGTKEGRVTPLGLILTPGTGGAPGVETRWSLVPNHGVHGEEAWTLSRLRARMQPEKSWGIKGGRGDMQIVPT